MAIMEVIAHLRANADNMVSGFRRAQTAAGQFGNSMTHTANLTQRGFSQMTKYAMLGATAMQGAAVTGATMGVRFAMANEQAIISFKTLLGSQQEAEAMFKSLQEFAATTPFEFPQLRDAASKLLTTGVEAERVIPIMTALGDSTAAMGTGAEGIQRAVYALQQMNLVGKITGQDMMQLANAGIPAWDALASAAGMSVQEVKKAVERGTLQNSVELLMTGIETYSGEAMGRVKGMMEEQSQTLTGLMSTLKDNVQIALGDMMKPATNAIKDALPAINDAVGETFRGMTEPINAMVTRVMEAFTQLIPIIGPTMIALSSIMIAAVEAIVPPLVEIATVALPALQPALEAVGQILADVGKVVGPLVADLTVGLLPIFMQLVEVVAMVTGFIADHEAAVATLTVVVGGLVAALVAYKAVSTVWNFVNAIRDIGIMIARTLGLTAATNIQTGAEKRLAAAQAAQAAAAMGAAGAQTALNTAMLMNPIGLAVVAIAALIAILVIAWKKFEGFRNFWKSVWNGIVDIAQKAINMMLGWYEWWLNKFIDGVNMMIRTWNKLPFGKKIGEIKRVNLELDITGAKVDIIKRKTEDLVKAQKVYLSKLQQANERWDKFGSKVIKPPKTEKPPGADDKALNAAAKLRDEIKRTYEQGIQKAREALQKLKDEHAEYNKSVAESITNNVNLNNALQSYGQSLPQIGTAVQNAITNMLSFTDVMSSQKAAVNALQQAQSRQKEVTDEVSEAQAELTKITRRYQMTRSSKERAAMLDEVRNATENLRKAEERLAETNKAVADAQTQADNAGKGFLAGLKAQLEAAKKFAKQIQDLRALNLSEDAISQILQAGAVVGGEIADELLAGGADAINASNTMTKQLLDLAKDTGDAVTKTFIDTGKSAADNILDAMEAEADRAKGFAEKIKTLVGLGLSKENLQNIIDAGAEAGGMIADALIAGGTPAVSRANTIKSSLETIAKDSAALAGSAYYSAGETLAKQLVDGLEAKWKELSPQLAKMTMPDLTKAAADATKSVGTTVDKITAIEPSNIPQVQAPQPAFTRDYWRDKFLEMVNKQFNKKWTRVNDYINAGVNATSKAARRKRWEDFVAANNVPALASGGIVRATAGGTLVQVGEGGRDEAVIPLTNSILSKMGGGNTTIQVTVNAGMGTDGAEVGKQIVKILQDYERKNGRVPLRSVR